MGVPSYHYYTQESNASNSLAIPQSLEASTDLTKSRPPNKEGHSTNPTTHPAESEEAWYFRNDTAEIAPPPPSPGRLPAKIREELCSQSKTIIIAPDENPLKPASMRGASYKPDIASELATGNHLPGQATHPNQYMTGGTWKHGLCDFGDIGVCCTGVWCPCIIYGKTQYRLSQKSERRDPMNVLGYSIFNGACLAFSVLCGCNIILASIQHSRVKRTYGIAGGVGTDFVRTCCCCCCTLAQDEKEIKFRETKARNRSESTAPMQYISPKVMDFAAPPC